MDATIIIPQRGKQELTERLVGQLAHHEPHVPVVVIDDGHGTKHAARPPIGEAAVVPNTNPGLTRAWNIGVRSSTARRVVLLNNDVECRGPFVEALCGRTGGGAIAGAKFREDPDVGMKVLEGWCLAFERATFDMLTGFDDSMELYFSDTDFQYRNAVLYGHALVAVPVPLVHLGHQTAHDVTIRPDRRRRWQKDRDAFRRKLSKIRQVAGN